MKMWKEIVIITIVKSQVMPKGKLKVYKVPNKGVIAIIDKTSVTSSIVTVHR